MKMIRIAPLLILALITSCGMLEERERRDKPFTLEGKWKSFGVGCSKQLLFMEDRIFQEYTSCPDGRYETSTGLYTYDNNVLTLDYIQSSCKALHNVQLHATFKISNDKLVVTDLVKTTVLQRYYGSANVCVAGSCRRYSCITLGAVQESDGDDKIEPKVFVEDRNNNSDIDETGPNQQPPTQPTPPIYCPEGSNCNININNNTNNNTNNNNNSNDNSNRDDNCNRNPQPCQPQPCYPQPCQPKPCVPRC